MKNKSKLKKIKQAQTTKNTKPREWLYMNEGKVSVLDIAAGLADFLDVKTQVWEVAGVLEIEIPEAKSIDIEETKLDLKDEYSNEFLQSHHIESLFLVTIDPENYDIVEKIMKQITKMTGGFFCGDTENFEPVI